MRFVSRLKRGFFVILALLCLFSMIPGTMQTAQADGWEGGSWSSFATTPGMADATTYIIDSREDMAWISKQMKDSGGRFNGYQFNLTTDIDLSAHDWVPIGDDIVPFEGAFNGGGHTIKGLTIGSSSSPCMLPDIGLFGFMNNNASVTNLHLAGVSVFAGDMYSAGGFVGYLNSGTIENCSVSGFVSGKADEAYVGGFAAYNNGSIVNCYSKGTVDGGGTLSTNGGFAGLNEGDIKNCSTYCTVLGGDASYTGGFIGNNYNGGRILNCYSWGDVTGGSATADFAAYTGGFAGYNGYYIFNCYATGDVTGGSGVPAHKSLIGGFVGKNYHTIINCYAAGSTAGGNSATLGGFTGGNGTNFYVTLTNTYWNSSASQIIGGVARETDLLGNGESTKSTDITYGVPADVMRGVAPAAGITYTSDTSGGSSTTDMSQGAFISALNGGIGALDTGATYLSWQADTGNRNMGYPVFASDCMPALKNAVINPAACDFNKLAPEDAKLSVDWNIASKITDVKKGAASIGTASYNISGHTLTIYKDYLSAQPIGSLVLTVEFNRGGSSDLTITIKAVAPPPAPTPTPIPTPLPTSTPTPIPTATATETPTAKPTAMPTTRPAAAPTATATATPSARPTISPDANTPSSSATVAPSPSVSHSVIAASIVEQNEGTGTVVIEIDVNTLPSGAAAIKLPSGDVIEVPVLNEILRITISADDIDSNGQIEIVALDDEDMPLGNYKVQVADKLETTTNNGAGIITILLWVIGVLFVAAAVVITVILIKRKKRL